MKPLATRAVNALTGRGFGSTSIRSEVRSALRFIPEPANAVVLDVGANKGLWSRELLKRCGGRVGALYVFEPSSANWSAIEASVGGAGELVRCAVGREQGRATLWADVPGSGHASLTKRRLDHFGMTFDESEEVEIVTLDDFVESRGIERVDFAKFDIEGHELDAFAGAAGLFGSRRISALAFEFGGANIDTRTYFQDFWYFLREHGYELRRITPFGLRRVSGYSEVDEFFLTTNYIATVRSGPG
jgi:FkbM family methyltransferase